MTWLPQSAARATLKSIRSFWGRPGGARMLRRRNGWRRAAPQCQVPLHVGAIDIEAVGVGELGCGAVGGAQHAVHRVAGGELDICIVSRFDHVSDG